jgi:hypothetical protein
MVYPAIEVPLLSLIKVTVGPILSHFSWKFAALKPSLEALNFYIAITFMLKRSSMF